MSLMEPMKINSSLGETGEFLMHLMHYFPQHATVMIKNTHTNQYTLTNQVLLKVLGIPNHGIIGASPGEMRKMLQPHWGVEYLDIIRAMDELVVKERKPIQDQIRAMRTPKGFVFTSRMTKIPVSDQRQNLAAILTFWEQHPLSLTGLFRLYQEFYSNRATAIDLFLQHIQVRHYFVTLPTIMEVYTLLAMRYEISHKGLAQVLGVQPKTIEHRVEHLRSKINHHSLHGILKNLREREGWTLPEIAEKPHFK